MSRPVLSLVVCVVPLKVDGALQLSGGKHCPTGQGLEQVPGLGISLNREVFLPACTAPLRTLSRRAERAVSAKVCADHGGCLSARCSLELVHMQVAACSRLACDVPCDLHSNLPLGERPCPSVGACYPQTTVRVGSPHQPTSTSDRVRAPRGPGGLSLLGRIPLTFKKIDLIQTVLGSQQN